MSVETKGGGISQQMVKVLLVKTSSMGDVIHCLPIVADIRRHAAEAEIDWVIEEPFAPIVALHPGVGRIIPVALRRWRKQLWREEHRRQIRQFTRELRSKTYDVVLDAQGLLKSGLICWLARGERCGFDWKSAWEPLATVFYDRRFPVDPALHAVVRYRLLAAQALGYCVRPDVDYGVVGPHGRLPWLPKRKYCVLLHATSRIEKQWPESSWVALGTDLSRRGLQSVLPGGSGSERATARRLAGAIPAALAPDAMSITEAASMLSNAAAVVGVDTGLTHLAVALGKPVIALYCGSRPDENGTYGSSTALNLGDAGLPPNVPDVIEALDRLL